MSSITRLFSIAGLILPVPLLIISFALTLATITSPDWAIAYLFDTTTDPVTFDTSRTQSRSPFWTCNFQGDGTDPNAVPTESCHRYMYPNQTCDINGPDNPHLCQQIVLSGNLLIAAAAFFCVAFLTAFAVVGLGWRGVISSSPHHSGPAATHTRLDKADGDWIAAEERVEAARSSRRPSPAVLPYIVSITMFFSIIATVLMFLAQLLGVNALVNDQSPNSDYASQIAITKPSTNSPLDTSTGPWLMGKTSLIWATTAWVSGGLAVFVAQMAWYLPRHNH